MANPFVNMGGGLAGPYANAAQLTPSDAVDLVTFTSALWVAGGTSLRVTMLGGEVVNFVLTGPTLLPIRVRRLHATGSTVTNAVGFW